MTFAFQQSSVVVLILALMACGGELRGQNQSPGLAKEFYQADQVQTIHLEISEESRKKLHEALPKRVFASATFRWRDRTLANVGVRFKGNSSSNPRQQHKRSYLIKFDKYQEGTKFLGLQRVSFDNGVQFGSLFSEPIVTEILRDLGIATHRANYAKLYVNDRFAGVYVNVERIDETYLAQRLGDANGALYKVDEGGPGGNLQFLGPDREDYRETFEAKSPTAESKREQLVNFIRLVNEPNPTKARQMLDRTFDADNFLKITAVMLYAGAFDQLTGWNPHNYYLFRNSETERWHYLPWDLDVGFSATAFGRIKVLEDWHAAWPTPPTRHSSPLMEKIVSDPDWLKQYRVVAKEVLEMYFEPERLCRILDAKYALIRDDLQRDPFPHRRVTNPTDRSYDDVVRSMKEFIRARYKKAKAELNNPGPRPEKPEFDDTPQFPPWVKPTLAKKLLHVHNGVKQLRDRNDLRTIHEVMRKVGPLVRDRKVEAAEELVDEALRRLDQIRSNSFNR